MLLMVLSIKYLMSKTNFFVIGLVLASLFWAFNTNADVTSIQYFPTNGEVILNNQPEGALAQTVSWDNVGDWTQATINLWIDSACTDSGSIITSGSCVSDMANPNVLCSWTVNNTNEQIKCATLALSGGTIDPDTEIPIASSDSYLWTFNSFLDLTDINNNQAQENLLNGFFIFMFSMVFTIWFFSNKRY